MLALCCVMQCLDDNGVRLTRVAALTRVPLARAAPGHGAGALGRGHAAVTLRRRQRAEICLTCVLVNDTCPGWQGERGCGNEDAAPPSQS